MRLHATLVDMKKDWLLGLLYATQIGGSICSVVTLAQGVRVLVIDLSNSWGVAWIAGFAGFLTLALYARARRDPTITQRGRESGPNFLRNRCIHYPIPFKSTPHLVVWGFRFKGPWYSHSSRRHRGPGDDEVGNGRTSGSHPKIIYEVVGQTAVSFTITSELKSALWSFKWKATGIPNY